MNERRLMLDDIFRTQVLGTDHVYFQPPESVKMQYPAIRYELNNIDMNYADDRPYMSAKRYSVTLIDKNPDSFLPDLITTLPFCSFSRFYTADNLNHWVFNLYF